MTQTVAEPTDIAIRKAIAATVTQGLITLYGSPVNVRVHDHWVLAQAIGENPSSLLVKNGLEKGLVHAWMVGLQSVSRTRPLPSSTMQGAHRLRLTNPNRRDVLRSYRVWCYHYLDTGTLDGESDDNSESKLALEIEAVADAFSKSPILGIDNPHIMGHEELQFAPIDVFSFGQIVANVAQGTLSVRLQKSLDLNQY